MIYNFVYVTYYMSIYCLGRKTKLRHCKGFRRKYMHCILLSIFCKSCIFSEINYLSICPKVHSVFIRHYRSYSIIVLYANKHYYKKYYLNAV